MGMDIQKILYATDFSPVAHEAFQAAIDTAVERGATLTLAHVIEPLSSTVPSELMMPATQEKRLREADAMLAEEKAAAERGGALRVETRRLDGVPWHAIVEEAKHGGHDIIILGTHGRTGLKHAFLGSVAERVVRHAPCSVMVVRPKAKAP